MLDFYSYRVVFLALNRFKLQILLVEIQDSFYMSEFVYIVGLHFQNAAFLKFEIVLRKDCVVIIGLILRFTLARTGHFRWICFLVPAIEHA